MLSGLKTTKCAWLMSKMEKAHRTNSRNYTSPKQEIKTSLIKLTTKNTGTTQK
jgi:hypothetical protein